MFEDMKVVPSPITADAFPITTLFTNRRSEEKSPVPVLHRQCRLFH